MKTPMKLVPPARMTDDLLSRYNALMEAIETNDVPTIKKLVNSNNNELLALQQDNGVGALIRAVQVNNPVAVQHFIDHGAVLNQRFTSNSGAELTALDLARFKGHRKVVKILVAACDAQDVFDGESRRAIAVGGPDGKLLSVTMQNSFSHERLTDRFAEEVVRNMMKKTLDEAVNDVKANNASVTSSHPLMVYR
ncbi:ankyrin repeat domain-containing protein [Burkholderia vietnamiensis]|uniref:ankyrin repeat domain-containing protein n=1 Tax=Burkholderia vietnamiensis TaxID=60552 RepID=UPI001CF25550|nr:ankyrin repeat domain-containing protein [Burkholderia vietnamiensis]MCA8448903.1 ankyrin repeat domain-containing protein [Burkholderia vietnamiensis]